MTLIQIIILFVVLTVLWRLYGRLRQAELSPREFVEWFLLWLAVAFVVLVPEMASYLAALVGVGRGVDLVTYAALLLIFYLLFKIFMRLERQERQLTQVVRSLALDKAEQEYKRSEQTPSQP